MCQEGHQANLSTWKMLEVKVFIVNKHIQIITGSTLSSKQKTKDTVPL